MSWLTLQRPDFVAGVLGQSSGFNICAICVIAFDPTTGDEEISLSPFPRAAACHQSGAFIFEQHGWLGPLYMARSMVPRTDFSFIDSALSSLRRSLVKAEVLYIRLRAPSVRPWLLRVRSRTRRWGDGLSLRSSSLWMRHASRPC